MARKIRMGMVGGGRNAFIGTVHRIAAVIDNQVELVCGCFSSEAQRSKDSGRDWFLPADRCYGSYQEMFEKEKQLPVGERMDFVAIVTPNNVHFDIARTALASGFNVLSEKPATFTLDEALKLRELVRKSGLLYGLTYNYTGYPMVKQARYLVQSGALGKIRKIVAEYPQGWLAGLLESTGQKQAGWRTDPKRAGASCCIGDIGTHAEHLAHYITGLDVEEVACEFTTFVPGRLLEDDANCLVRFQGGARGIIYSSQISVDEENDLTIRVYGEKGGLEWHQIEPNTLIVKHTDRPREIYRTNGKNNCEAALAAIRLPAGHPEAYLEAFAVLYRNYATVLRKRLEGQTPSALELDFPGIEDAVRSMAFIATCVESAQRGAAWTKLKV